jgi:Uma2 family endonuclease
MSTAERLITADELLHLPEEETQWCELIDGEIVPMAPPGGMHGVVAARLTLLLGAYVRGHRLGEVFAAETGFVISRNPDTVLAPDGSFVRRERIAKLGIPLGYLTEAPALVIEVMSPGDRASRVALKMRRWFSAGAELAWVVDPAKRTVAVYHSADDARLLSEHDVLSGESVVPGFECSIAELFDIL